MKKIYFALSISFMLLVLSNPNAQASSKIIIDDYTATSSVTQEWYYSRIGTDRGTMGDGDFLVELGGGKATITVNSGWAGIWTSLVHKMTEPETLDLNYPLGQYIKKEFQPQINEIEIQITDAYGKIKLECKDENNLTLFSETFDLDWGKRTLRVAIPATTSIKSINLIVDGKGYAIVNKLCFLYELPEVLNTATATFLYTYGHLTQCYDNKTGSLRDRARWPINDYAAIQATGAFALVTAVAYDLGFIEENSARSIIESIKDNMLTLPTHNGLLPHFLINGDIAETTEYSTIDSVISLISTIMACQSLNISTASLEEMINAFDWNELTERDTRSISHGYAKNELIKIAPWDLIENRWDVFGSETFIMALAYAASTGNVCKVEKESCIPTWDGSGFNDEMANLFFKMDKTDAWGNNWNIYRKQAAERQINYFLGHYYDSYGFFGVSASEIPEPWLLPEPEPSASEAPEPWFLTKPEPNTISGDTSYYVAWGLGGHNKANFDGVAVMGYPVIAPHYAAMISSDYPKEFATLFDYLLFQDMFSPLGNVESFGMSDDDEIHWNSLKGSWNLCLQALGTGKLLSGTSYLPWRMLEANKFLKSGLTVLFPTDKIVQTQISQLYVAIFGRASEGEGNIYWQGNQPDMISTANVMLSTDSAKNYFGSSLDSNLEFIKHIYENTLGKTIVDDPDGIAYWVAELISGKSRGEVIFSLINAAQELVNMGNAQDQFNNKVKVSNYVADKIFNFTGDFDFFINIIKNVTHDDTTVDDAKAVVDAL